MKKRFLSLTAAVLLVMAFTVNAAARVEQNEPRLSISGTTATCFVNYRSAGATDRVKVTLTLWCGESIVDSWSNSGTGSVTISENCTVVRGNTYELVMIPTVNGVVKPQVSVTARS